MKPFMFFTEKFTIIVSFIYFNFFVFFKHEKNISDSEDFQICQFFISNFSYILIKLYYQFRCILKMPDS